MNKYYTVDNDKLSKVTEVYNNTNDTPVTEEQIENFICDDWSEGDEHQQWIDTATPEEIADWIVFS